MREQLLCIRGNCDCEVDQMVLQFPIMADYAALWLNGHMVWATHGTSTIWIITRLSRRGTSCCTATPHPGGAAV